MAGFLGWTSILSSDEFFGDGGCSCKGQTLLHLLGHDQLLSSRPFGQLISNIQTFRGTFIDKPTAIDYGSELRRVLLPLTELEKLKTGSASIMHLAVLIQRLFSLSAPSTRCGIPVPEPGVAGLGVYPMTEPASERSYLYELFSTCLSLRLATPLEFAIWNENL